jgi:hypothetical protein
MLHVVKAVLIAIIQVFFLAVKHALPDIMSLWAIAINVAGLA